MTRPGLIIWFALLLAASLYYFGSRYHFAPDTQIEHLAFTDAQGQDFSIQHFKGKSTMLHFYAAWCAPCLNELPGLLEAESDLKEMGINIVGLTDDQFEKINMLQREYAIGFPIYRLKGNLRSNGIPSIPTTFIINDQGEIVFSISGPANWNSPELLTEIKQKLGDSF